SRFCAGPVIAPGDGSLVLLLAARRKASIYTDAYATPDRAAAGRCRVVVRLCLWVVFPTHVLERENRRVERSLRARRRAAKPAETLAALMQGATCKNARAHCAARHSSARFSADPSSSAYRARRPSRDWRRRVCRRDS